ncbi:hypothetical protein BV20DRAFT_960760 [Pilatotrama ljubarskyi]|nr:hypothetical protein BV20DRAFT_960760 [Pilatotrama ljubarskyi]
MGHAASRDWKPVPSRRALTYRLPRPTDHHSFQVTIGVQPSERLGGLTTFTFLLVLRSEAYTSQGRRYRSLSET